MLKATGVYRTTKDNEDIVRVEYSPHEVIFVPRWEYEVLGFRPSFSRLPTREEHEDRLKLSREKKIIFGERI
jgi:hypothetical protein